MYARTKREGEKAVLTLSNSVVLRLSNMIGKGFGKFLDFLVGAVQERKSICLRNDEVRSFVSLSDVVKIIRFIVLDKGRTFIGGNSGRIFNVGGPEALSRLQLGEIVARHLGVRLLVGPRKQTEEVVTGKGNDEEKENTWRVFEQSNQEAVAASGIFNPRDVSMDSSATEAAFHVKFETMDTTIAKIFKEK